MKATRRQFLRGGLGLAAASRIDGAAAWTTNLAAQSGTSKIDKYGSGNFGAWTEDEFGLPAFRYAANQTTDPRAVTDLQPGVLSSTEHIHQVGNDCIIALASNYGHVRVRQDEGSPKFLNDFDPEMSQFGGGFGYLMDGQQVLSTYYDGSKGGFERIFGVGYYRKKIANKDYAVDQVIHAPFGDDQVLISQVTVSNRKNAAATLRWVEYWGCQPFQFSFRSALEGAYGKRSQTEWRRDMGRRFDHHVTRIADKGLLDTKSFPGRAENEDAAWERAKAALKANPNGFYKPVENLKPGTAFESLEVPRTFLVSLDGATSALSSDAASFFGTGGPANPGGL